MQGVAAKNDASYDLSRARASVTGQTTIAASTATTALPNGRIVTALRPLLFFYRERHERERLGAGMRDNFSWGGT